MYKIVKVLSINVSDTNGGAARAAYRIHNAVKSFGVRSQMFVKHKSSNDENVLCLNSFKSKNYFTVAFRYVEHKFKNKIQYARWKKYPFKENVFMSDLRSVSIDDAFQKIDFDVLHLHWINLRFLDLEELVKINKPIVWTLHDCWPFTGICHYFNVCTKYKKKCESCPLLHSNKKTDLSYKIWKEKQAIYSELNLHIVCPSNWLAKAAQQSSLFKNIPITVIPNAIDITLFKPMDRLDAYLELGLNSAKKYVLFGAMNAVEDKRKGFKELVAALKFIEQKDTCSELELLVFGADRPLKDLELCIPIRYLGMINKDDKMISAYCVADVMVVPSLSENLSNAIMESMACGTPVVGFNIGGNGDMIEHQINGYLASPFDSKDIADGICWCLDNNYDKKLSIMARKKVENNYSFSKIGETYSSLYKSLNN